MSAANYRTICRGLFLVMALLLLPASQVLAVDIVVDDGCTLAEAIVSANTGALPKDSTASCELGDADTADTIVITEAGTASGTITLAGELPSVVSVIVIEGNGFTVDGNGEYQIFDVFTNGDLTINRLTLSNASGGSGDGGAVIQSSDSVLTINNSRISNSGADSGGGLYIDGGTATVANSTISDNTVTDSGSGVYIVSGTVTITNSSISSNTAAENGGGLYIEDGTVTIANTTISENIVRGAKLHLGAGLFVSDGTVTLTHVTIVNNTVDDGKEDTSNVGGGLFLDGGTLNLRNSLLSGNKGDDCTESHKAGLSENSGNFIADGTCAPQTVGAQAAAETDPLAALSGNPMLGKAMGSPAYVPLKMGSPAIDTADEDYCEETDQAGTERPQMKGCDIGAYEAMPQSSRANGSGESGSGRGGSGGNDSGTSGSEAKVPSISTCLTLPASIIVSQISDGVQCRILDAAGIGILEVIQAGFIDAVDVWGYLGGGVEVCFKNSGSLVFLDAATSPRNVLSLAGYSKAGMTCTLVERPGSVVLVPGPAPAAIEAEDNLADCQVTLNAHLNFRARPGGAIMSTLPQGVTLTAMKYEAGWFQVDFYGLAGWVSADYVTPHGSCG